jgi:hypothetical protein
MFLEGTAVSALVLFVLMVTIGTAAGERAFGEVVGIAALVGLGGGLLLGLFSAALRYLVHTRCQQREVILPCDFETACDLCLASFDLFPNRRVLESRPGAYEALVNNNPMLASLPASLTPEQWGWAERVKLTVVPIDGSQTRVRIETQADLNRAAQVVVERKRHNADVIREYLEQQCAKRG